MADRSNVAPENLIQRPDLIFRLQQFLGLRQGAILPKLNEGLQAVVLVGDVREESREKVIERPCWGRIGLAVTPGEAQIALRNPEGSGVVIRTQQIGNDFPGPGLKMFLEARSTDLFFKGPKGFRDMNPLVSESPVGILSGDQAAALGGNHYRIEPIRDPLTAGAAATGTGWTIHPGVALVMYTAVLTGPSVSILWTESRG